MLRILSLLSVLLIVACSSTEDAKDKLADQPADVLYGKAEAAMKEGEYSEATRLYEEVERQHPYSDLAAKAQLKAAKSYYDGQRYDDALVALDRFIELHPGHPEVGYAHYLKALCYYEQISDVRRDQDMTQQALQSLNVVVERFPESEYARDAKLKRDLTVDHLAGQQMEIGRYYLKRKHINAAINRFRNVVTQYQTTTHIPEALHRLVECYTILGLKNEATRIAAVLGHNYPGSEWYADTYALLQPDQREQLEDKKSWLSRTMDSLL